MGAYVSALDLEGNTVKTVNMNNRTRVMTLAKSFTAFVSVAVCLCIFSACTWPWPTAPVDDFSMLPDNVFTASVRKHVRTGLPIELSKFEEDFLGAFDHEEIETVIKAFQANGGSCVLPEAGNVGGVVCKIAFQWKTTALRPPRNGASAIGLAYQIVTTGNWISRVSVQLYPTPLK